MSYVKRKYIEGQKMENQLKNPVKGIVAVIGDYGTGKTTFALENGYHPKDIIFINDNVKVPPHKDKFKTYIDLMTDTGKKIKPLDLHSHCLELIHGLGKAKIIIWDTWTRCASTFISYVKAHQNEFRESNQYSQMGKIKSGEMYKDSYVYEGRILNELQNKCDLLIITFHLKDAYEDNVKIVGRRIPGNDKGVTEYSDLRLWLMNNPDGAIPTGIVLKNIVKSEITSTGIKPIQVLPKRLGVANWPTIFQYWKKPIGNRKLTEDEKPSKLEMSLIEGTLTDEEKRLYEASIGYIGQQQKENDKLMKIVNQSQLKEAVQALNGESPKTIFDQIKAQIESGKLEYNGELTMKNIVDVL